MRLGTDFLTSSCQQAIWQSWMVLVRFSSVEDVTYPGPMKWMMRAAGLVTFDLAAWLLMPCVEWSYYHTLLFATIVPLVCVAVAVVYKNFEKIKGKSYKNFEKIKGKSEKAACSCAKYLRERLCSGTQVAPGPAPAQAPAPAPAAPAPVASVPEARAPVKRNLRDTKKGLNGRALTAYLAHDVQSFFYWCFSCPIVVRALIMVHAPICSVLFEFFHFDGTEYKGFSTGGHKREFYLARDYTIKETSARYQAYRRYAILCCMIYVILVPLAFFSALFIEKLRKGHFDGKQ